jgi:hypothetical protein
VPDAARARLNPTRRLGDGRSAAGRGEGRGGGGEGGERVQCHEGHPLAPPTDGRTTSPRDTNRRDDRTQPAGAPAAPLPGRAHATAQHRGAEGGKGAAAPRRAQGTPHGAATTDGRTMPPRDTKRRDDKTQPTGAPAAPLPGRAHANRRSTGGQRGEKRQQHHTRRHRQPTGAPTAARHQQPRRPDAAHRGSRRTAPRPRTRQQRSTGPHEHFLLPLILTRELAPASRGAVVGEGAGTAAKTTGGAAAETA